jgi:hypothetical protein
MSLSMTNLGTVLSSVLVVVLACRFGRRPPVLDGTAQLGVGTASGLPAFFVLKRA